MLKKPTLSPVIRPGKHPSSDSASCEATRSRPAYLSCPRRHRRPNQSRWTSDVLSPPLSFLFCFFLFSRACCCSSTSSCPEFGHVCGAASFVWPRIQSAGWLHGGLDTALSAAAAAARVSATCLAGWALFVVVSVCLCARVKVMPGRWIDIA